MTNAPTTRETADHAELARLAAKLRETKYRWTMGYRDDVLLNPDGPKAADALETLLSEIAALRSDLAKTERDYSELRDSYDAVVAKLAIERDHGAKQSVRATQAERQRDEAVGLLREWMGTWFVDSDSRGEKVIADDTRKFLANQGADQ